MEYLSLMGFVFSGSATLVVLHDAYKSSNIFIGLFNISLGVLNAWLAAYGLDTYIKSLLG